MTNPDRLTIEVVDRNIKALTDQNLETTIGNNTREAFLILYQQLADTMRENQRLTELLEQRFMDGKRLGVIETYVAWEAKEKQNKESDNG